MGGAVFGAVASVALIGHLGSDHYPTREQAHRDLERLLPLVMPYIAAATRHDDPEIAARSHALLECGLDQFVRQARYKALQARPRHYGKLPWVCRLPESFPDRELVSWRYLGRVQAFQDGGPPDWIGHRRATLLLLEDLYSDPETATHVPDLLDAMADNEIEWIRQHGGNFSPPLTLPSPWGD